jgi:AraC-like DNA-binding protein
LRHIRDNYDKAITVDDLSGRCGLSKYYFCHNFKAVTGKSAMEYLRDYRITTADVILTHTDESIEKIAKNCGFESANYFCRCYKKHFNTSPGKRRNMLRK